VPLTIALPHERRADERRVALVPAATSRLLAAVPGLAVRIESGCGRAAGFHDEHYAGVSVASDFARTVTGADIVVKVRLPTLEEIALLAPGTVLVTLTRAFQHLPEIEALADGGITTIAMDLVPRTTRARSMDALSSQATVAGYKAALLAAELSPRLFPMMTTAAGTIRPSRVVVVGAGVAGLQAIATARRLGAEVEAYDIRSRARERIESLGARMIDTGVEAVDSQGRARALRRDEQQQQQEVLAEHLARAHAVICAASIPYRPAPRIVTRDMVEGMLPDTVIVDMAAATGGNCELTRAGEQVQHGDTLIVGPLNLPSHGAVHASEMYARNVANLLALIIDAEGELVLDGDDDIVARCMLTCAGGICHAPSAALAGRQVQPFGDAPERSVGEDTDTAEDWAGEMPGRVPADAEKVRSERSAVARADETRTDEGSEAGPSDRTASGGASPAEDVTDRPASGRTAAEAGDRPIDAPPAEESAAGAVLASGSMAAADGAAGSDASAEGAGEGTTGAARREDEGAVEKAQADGEPASPPDDLTVIDGIGPALQERLYAFGVTRLEMLAALDEPARRRLAVQLELDEEIEDEDWAGQARARLANAGPSEGSD